MKVHLIHFRLERALLVGQKQDFSMTNIERIFLSKESFTATKFIYLI